MVNAGKGINDGTCALVGARFVCACVVPWQHQHGFATFRRSVCSGQIPPDDINVPLHAIIALVPSLPGWGLMLNTYPEISAGPANQLLSRLQLHKHCPTRHQYPNKASVQCRCLCLLADTLGHPSTCADLIWSCTSAWKQENTCKCSHLMTANVCHTHIMRMA